MPRPDRKQREFDRREEDILDAALELCSGPEWESVSVDQIANRADVSKGTVYNHFSSKDELIFRLMMRFYGGLFVQFEAIAEHGGVECLGDLFRSSLEYHVANSEYRYVVLYCERADFKQRSQPEWREDLRRLDDSFESIGVPLIQQGMASGEFQNRPVEEVAIGLHAAFKGGVSMLWMGGDWCSFKGDEQTMINSITEFMMAGLRGRP